MSVPVRRTADLPLGRQATVFAEITEATLKAVPGIVDPSRDGYDDTADDAPGDPESVEYLFESPMVHTTLPEVESSHKKLMMQSDKSSDMGTNRAPWCRGCPACRAPRRPPRPDRSPGPAGRTTPPR